MKQVFLAAVLSVLVSTASIAANTLENARIESVFKAEFPGATNIRYKIRETIVCFYFTMNQQIMEAFYDNDGNKLAVSRVIGFVTLPMPAQLYIQQKYSRYNFIEAAELIHEQEGRAYYVSMKNETEKIILKVNTDAQVSIFKKTRFPK